MGLDFFTSSYLQYKEDTNAVATWLVATARKCGFPVDTLGGEPNTNTPTAQPSKRLKGKARKQAKAAGPKPSAIPAQPTHILGVKDFVSLSDYIAAATNPKVRVPEGFVAVLNRAISVRRRHGDQAEEASPDAASTERHNHFIGILEHVKQALRPLMPSDQIKDPLTQRADEQPGGKVGNLINKFNGLGVEEPSDAFLQAPVTIPPVVDKDDKPQVDYEAERLQDVEEATFAFSLLLNDYGELRRVISSSWDGYKKREFDLVSVSLMTNSAIDIAQRMEEEIQHLLNKFGGSEKFLHMTYMALAMAEGEDPKRRERPGDDLNFRVYNIAQSVFLPACMLLRAFSDVVEPNFAPLYKPGHYGTLNRHSDRSKKNGRDRFLEDKIILTEILGDFFTLHKSGPAQAYEDEFTRGLRNLFVTKQLPIWLVFAAQVYLDIQHLLRDNIERPFTELSVHAGNIKRSIEQNFAFHSNLSIMNWPKQNDQMIKHFVGEIDSWIQRDFTKSFKRKYDLWNPDEEFKFLKWHPVLCGTLTYYFKAHFQQIGLIFATAWGSILYSAHLYNALRREKLISGQWFDLDLVMVWHNEMFIGERPRNSDAYLKQFNFSTGLSASAYAKNRRQTARLPEAKNGPKGLQPVSNVSHVFFERYCEGTRKTGLDAADLEKILADGVWAEDLADRDGAISMTRDVAKNYKSKSAAKTFWDISHRLPPTQILTTLRNTLQVEAPELAFDYLMLHRVCWQNLRMLHQACDSRLRQIYGVQYLENESQLPFVIGYIFMAAAGVDQLGKRLDLEKFGSVKSELMVTAAEVINAMIEVGAGSVVRKEMEAQGYYSSLEL